MHGIFYGFAVGSFISGFMAFVLATTEFQIYLGLSSMIFGFFMFAFGRIVQVLEQIRDKVGK